MSGRQRFHLIVRFVLMGELLKHLLSNEYGPFDRFLEIGVFLLILYEIVSPHALIHRAARKRKLHKIETILRRFISDGETMRVKASDWRQPTYDHNLTQAAESWSIDVEKYLSRSEKALAEFRRVRLEDTQRLHVNQFGGIGRVSGTKGDFFQLLSSRLENLYRIAHKCEDYF